ncbi:hypothetical protein Ancab_013041 [Ancistrocladus abbreviatus]
MVPEVEKPRVTEIQVRMDCNGCVQKIKKALNGINGKHVMIHLSLTFLFYSFWYHLYLLNHEIFISLPAGIYNMYIDFPQQKITIIGWADPEKIVKAIKKTRKIATICSHTEVNPPAQPSEPAPDGGAPPPPPPPDAENPPPSAEPPPAEAPLPPSEPPKDQPPPPPLGEPPKDQQQPPPPPPLQEPPKDQPPPLPHENPPPQVAPPNPGQPVDPSRPRDVGEVHVVHHHPPDFGYRYSYGPGYGPAYGQGYSAQWSSPPPGPSFRHERPHPVYVTHSYNTHRPSPYVTEYEYIQSPPRYTSYARMDHYYNGEYQNASSYSNGNITSMFSDENPNACTIS